MQFKKLPKYISINRWIHTNDTYGNKIPINILNVIYRIHFSEIYFLSKSGCWASPLLLDNFLYNRMLEWNHTMDLYVHAILLSSLIPELRDHTRIFFQSHRNFVSRGEVFQHELWLQCIFILNEDIALYVIVQTVTKPNKRKTKQN